MNARSKIIWIGVFGVTMGYFEAAVVEYLRIHFYPEGFAFPLKDFPKGLLLIELGREAASIFMLISAGWLAGRDGMDRFAGFMYGFGVWDITYYIWLKLFENWPPSILTDDLLFLIPLPWVGPVWAPIGVSVGLIWAAVTYWRLRDAGIELRLQRSEWVGIVAAGVVIILSFLWNAPEAMAKEALTTFPWLLWVIGILTGVALFLRAVKRASLKRGRLVK